VAVNFAEYEWKGDFGEIEKVEAKPLEVAFAVFYWFLIQIFFLSFIMLLSSI